MNDIQRRSAVIVGVSSYQDSLSNLPNTRNDAERLARILIERCQFDPDRVYLLIGNSGKGEEFTPTKPNILDKIEYLVKNAGENEIILFFFAGHGAEVSGSPYLVTADTRLNVLDQTAIDVAQLNARLEESKARFVIRIFDACRNNFGPGRAILRGMTPDLQAALLKKVNGWATFSACSSDQYAHEDTDSEHGVFSRYLCEGLEGKAVDRSGNVTLEGLVAYVKGAVEAWCDQRAKEQQPQFQLDIVGQFIFSQATPDKPEVAPSPPEEGLPLSPMEFLAAELDSHLAEIPLDVRDIALTSSEQIDQIAQSIRAALAPDLKAIHPTLRAALGKVKMIDLNTTRKLPPWNSAYKTAASTGVAQEWQEIRIMRAAFASSRATIPNSALHIAVVRFTFFFWIWWALVCETKALDRTFQPKPSAITDFRTLVPHAALDDSKVRPVIKVILDQSSEQILQWSKQLAEFIDKTVDPLRQFSDIINSTVVF
jgi:hypothetical protein